MGFRKETTEEKELKISHNYDLLNEEGLVKAFTFIKEIEFYIEKIPLIGDFKVGELINEHYVNRGFSYQEITVWVKPEELDKFRRDNLPIVLDYYLPSIKQPVVDILETLTSLGYTWQEQEPFYNFRFYIAESNSDKIWLMFNQSDKKLTSWRFNSDPCFIELDKEDYLSSVREFINADQVI